VSTGVLLSVQVFWDVTLGRWVRFAQHF